MHDKADVKGQAGSQSPVRVVLFVVFALVFMAPAFRFIRFHLAERAAQRGGSGDSYEEPVTRSWAREGQGATFSYRAEKQRTAAGTEFDLCPPHHLEPGTTYPLFLFLSPTAVPDIFLPEAALACQAENCFYAASYHFRNDVSHRVFLPKVTDVLNELQARFPIAPDRIFLAGMSGGGMGCYVIPYFAPGIVRGSLVCNGALHHNLHDPTQLAATRLEGVAILSGERDQVVTPEHILGNQKIIQAAGIPVHVFPFAAGHELPPTDLWRQGIRWLLETCPPRAEHPAAGAVAPAQ